MEFDVRRIVGIVLISSALSGCSHLVNESYLRQGCRDYAAALSQLAQFRSAARLTAAQIEQIDQQNVLVVGAPVSGRYGVCTTPHEPSNPSGADDTAKYARNVLRGLIDAANAATPAPDGPSPSVTELVATYVHLHVVEAVEFESWSAIASDVVAAGEAWQSSAPRP
jgi:hypothetical protein